MVWVVVGWGWLGAAAEAAVVVVTYSYDDLNRVQSVARNDGPSFGFSYDEVGNIVTRTGTNPDTDGDGLKDVDEAVLGTKARVPDTDGDGLTDGQEVLTYTTNPLRADTDGDGLSDGAEVLTYGSNPLVTDSDGDGVVDGADNCPMQVNPGQADCDGDGVGDACDPDFPCPVGLLGDLAPRGAPDGVLTMADVTVLLRFIEGLATPTPEEAVVADLNLDGVVDLRDAVILMHTLGLGGGTP